MKKQLTVFKDYFFFYVKAHKMFEKIKYNINLARKFLNRSFVNLCQLNCVFSIKRKPYFYCFLETTQTFKVKLELSLKEKTLVLHFADMKNWL